MFLIFSKTNLNMNWGRGWPTRDYVPRHTSAQTPQLVNSTNQKNQCSYCHIWSPMNYDVNLMESWYHWLWNIIIPMMVPTKISEKSIFFIPLTSVSTCDVRLVAYLKRRKILSACDYFMYLWVMQAHHYCYMQVFNSSIPFHICELFNYFKEIYWLKQS